jgi:epoxyqueuosine reductase QueG
VDFESVALANRIVEGALAPCGIALVASCAIDAYDARAPEALRSSMLMPEARGVIVVASAGRAMWRAFRAYVGEDPARLAVDHPLDAFVARALSHADEALARGNVAFRRFEPTIYAEPALDFRALGELVGLGSLGPFGMLIHDTHGAWWALRGAYMVAADVDPPHLHSKPCFGCAAPCVGAVGVRAPVGAASVEMRARCVVGQASRYEDEQIAYHYDRDETLARLRRG